MALYKYTLYQGESIQMIDKYTLVINIFKYTMVGMIISLFTYLIVTNIWKTSGKS